MLSHTEDSKVIEFREAFFLDFTYILGCEHIRRVGEGNLDTRARKKRKTRRGGMDDLLPDAVRS